MIIFLLILPFVYPKPYSTYEDILGHTLVHVYIFVTGVSSKTGIFLRCTMIFPCSRHAQSVH